MAAAWVRADGCDDPVAIIGMSCRLPKVADPAAFWRLLCRQRSAVAAARWGGYLRDLDRFDADFFGISMEEAAATDPHQRLAVELCWEALEAAGIVPRQVNDGETGVYIGVVRSDDALSDRPGVPPPARGAAARSTVAHWVSNLLGARGPSMTVDAAQASSLVAVHLASESIRRGESTIALAGGVHLNLSSQRIADLAAQGYLSPDGRCRVLDAHANGYVLGEGGGFVVLKRLSRAVTDDEQIFGVILGSAVNHDGHASTSAREDVLRSAHQRARIRPSDVAYVELDGAGILTGDLLEATALGTVIGAARPTGSPLAVGSAKTNVGHLGGAAGVIGLIKTTLCVTHRSIPASLNFDTPHPQVPFQALNIQVQKALERWGDDSRPMIAGVNSFSFSGTNCHVVVSEPPSPAGPLAARAADPPTVTLVVSGRCEASLRAQAERLRGHLLHHPDLELEDVAYSLATARTRFAHAAVVAGERRDELLDGLTALVLRKAAPNVRRSMRTDGKIAWLFGGRGMPGAGRELYERLGDYRRTLHAVCDGFEPRLGRAVRDWVLANGATVADDAIEQAALFTLELSLCQLLWHWGLRPDLVAGQSFGELVAAHAAGVLSVEDACALASTRCELNRHDRRASMLVLFAPEHEVRPLLADLTSNVDIVAVTGAESVVVSGDSRDTGRVANALRARGYQTRRLRSEQVLHPVGRGEVGGLFESAVAKTSFAPPRIPVVSSLTGDIAVAAEICSHEYWRRQVQAPTRLFQAVRCLERQGVTTFVDLTSGGTLSTIGRDCLIEPDKVELVPALRVGRRADLAVATAVALLHARGAEVDWPALFPVRRPRRVELPTYPFQRRRLAPGPPESRMSPAAPNVAASNDRSADAGRSSPTSTVGHLVGADVATTRVTGPPLLCVLTGHDEQDLRAAAGRLGRLVREDEGVPTLTVPRSLVTPREELPRRAVVIGDGREDLLEGLDAVAAGRRARGVVRGVARRVSPPVAFVFAGQGGQWVGMGQELLDSSAVFAHAIAACERALAPHVDWSLDDVLRKAADAPSLDRVDVLPPVLWAIMVAVAELWRSHGVSPRAVVGHSQGEVAAAAVAGVLSLSDAAMVVASGSQAVAAVSGRGGMASVALPPEVVARRLERWGPRLSIAAVNGPSSVVVSGELGALSQWMAECDAERIATMRLGAGYAAHSADMDQIGSRLMQRWASVTPRSGQIPFYSAVSGGPVDGTSQDAAYWYANLRQPVLFEPAMRALLDDGHRAFIEISAHPTLTVSIEQILDYTSTDAVVIGSLWRGDGGLRRWYTSLAHAYTQGVAVRWSSDIDGPANHLPPEAQSDVVANRVAVASNPPPQLADPLGGASTVDQDATMLDLVHAEVAALLDDPADPAVVGAVTFAELGFDSATAVELRNRLADITGLPLPVTLIFDLPTPAALAEYLDRQLAPQMTSSARLLEDLAELDRTLATVDSDDARYPEIGARLQTLYLRWAARSNGSPTGAAEHDISRATVDEIFTYIDKELGLS